MEELKEPKPEEWDCYATNLFQTVGFARAMQKMNGATPIYLRSGYDIALGLDLEYSGNAKKMFRTYTWRMTSDLFVPKIEALAEERNIYSNRIIAPNIDALEGAELQWEHTYLVDLRPSKEALWSKLNKTCRKEINKCRNANVEIRFMKQSELPEYISLLEATRLRMGFGMPPVYPCEALIECLGDKVKVVVALVNNEIVGGLGLLCFGNTLTEIAFAQQKDIAGKLPVSVAIKWFIIEWGSANGYDVYDLAGVKPDSEDVKEKGIYEFKSKFGGELVSHKEYVKVYSPLKKKVFEIVKRLKNGKT